MFLELNDMEFKILTEKEKKLFELQMINMLTLADKEFVPPLSERSSTTQGNLSAGGTGGINSYYADMAKQEILCALEGEEVLGFVSYRKDYVSELISESELPNIYISTLVLSPAARGRGLTSKMYSFLFDELYPECSVFTRTWSTNIAHTKILSKFGFSELLRKENDRGEGIDTVYYKRERSKALLLV